MGFLWFGKKKKKEVKVSVLEFGDKLEVKPVEEKAAPAPEAKPAEVKAAPAPEAKPAEAKAAPAPEAKPAEVKAAPAPEAKPAEEKKPAAKKAAPKAKPAEKKEEAEPEKKEEAKAPAKKAAPAEEKKPAAKKAEPKPAEEAPKPVEPDDEPEFDDESAETVTESKSHVTYGTFDIKKAKDGRYVFNLYAANKVMVATSQIYSSSQSAMTGVKSVMANAANAPIEDSTLKNPTVYPFPKWEVYMDRAGEYRFRLYATNGNCICHAKKGYSTKSNCKRGIESIIRFVSEANIDKSYLAK
ncbi:MAG: YegP family protein [Clostridia bacterium]|nr:YegP family protein [Clostridia bacterium]